ncbi:MAG: peptide ABC transporter substrate-binding protein [Anaerolineae bacterium]
MRSHGKWLAIIAVLSIVAIVAAACGSTPTPEVVKETVVVEVMVTPTAAAAEATGVTLHTLLGTEPPTIDPAVSQDTTSVWLVEQLFLALTDYDDETLEVVPELATSWDISSDGKVYTFHMRDDAKWVNYSGGNVTEVGPLTANDVVYGILRTLDPRTASPYAYVLTTYIAGADEFNTADPTALTAEELTALHDAVGVTAPDDYTVEITLKQPASFFPAIASLWVMRPQPQAVIEEIGERWIEPGLIVTSGPYMLSEWQHGASLTLAKNPLWYDAANVQIEVIEAPIVSEESTAMAMYENGELDYMGDPGWGPPLPDMDRVKADPVLSAEFKILPRLCTYYYGFMVNKAPFDDAKVRQAFSYAIDRQTLIDTLLKGEQQPANSFTGPGIFGNVAGDPEIGILFDAEKAKALLAEAGYPDGAGFPQVTLMLNQSEAHMQIAQAVQAMWKDVLNVDVNIEQQEWAVYLETLQPSSPDEDKPEIYRMGWCADYMDANNYLADVLDSASTQNYSKYSNPEFDALVRQAQTEADANVRLDLYRQAETILNNVDSPNAPIYFYTRVTLEKPYLTRIVNPLNMDHVYKWTIDVAAQAAARGG